MASTRSLITSFLALLLCVARSEVLVERNVQDTISGDLACTNFTELTPVWGLLNSSFQVNVGAIPSLFRLSPVVNPFVTVSITINFTDVVNAGCSADDTISAFTFGDLVCSSNKSIPLLSVNSTLIWHNSPDYNGSSTMIGNSPTYGYMYFFLQQPARLSNGSTTVVCNSYPVTVYLEGNYTKTCLNNGTLSYVTGICTCPTNFTGDTCAFYGECDPSEPARTCTYNDKTKSTGVQNCRVADNFQTYWGECQDINNKSNSNSKKYMWIGIGAGAGIAVIGIIIGIVIANRRRAHYDRVV